MNWWLLPMNDKYVIGIDIGKTKIAFGVFQMDMQIVKYILKPSMENATRILDTIEDTIRCCFEEYHRSIIGIGIAAFGVIDAATGTVISSKIIKDWNDILLKKHFESLFRVPVFVENDVKAAALGELYSKNNQNDLDSLLYFSVGTSIGIAFIEKKSLCYGANKRFGEISTFHPAGSKLKLGDIIGGNGIAEQYHSRTGSFKSAAEIFSLAQNGDPISREIFNYMIATIVELLRWLVICFDPSYLIIGGGMICKNEILFNTIRDKYNSYFDDTHIQLTVAGLGENSGIYGAAIIALKNIDYCVKEKDYYV